MNGSLLVFILHIQAHTTPRMHAPCARTATPAGMGRKQEGRRPCVFTPKSGSKVAAGIWSEKNFIYLCTTKTARCSVRLTVRTTDSQSVNKGSIPLNRVRISFDYQLIIVAQGAKWGVKKRESISIPFYFNVYVGCPKIRSDYTAPPPPHTVLPPLALKLPRRSRRSPSVSACREPRSAG